MDETQFEEMITAALTRQHKALYGDRDESAPRERTWSVSLHENRDDSPTLDEFRRRLDEAVLEIGAGGTISFDYGYDGDVGIQYTVTRVETQEEAIERIEKAKRDAEASREYREAQEKANYERLKAKYGPAKP